MMSTAPQHPIQTYQRHISGDDSIPYIDCEGSICAIYERIQHYIAQFNEDCTICQYFQKKIGARMGAEADARLILHAQINMIFALFEKYQDQDYIDLLHQVEDDCC